MKTMIRRLRQWWNRPIVVKVKSLCLTLAVVLSLIGALQYQTDYQAGQARCRAEQTRADSRADLRNVLFHIVDLHDVFPTNERASEYARNRVAYINSEFPALNRPTC